MKNSQRELLLSFAVLFVSLFVSSVVSCLLCWSVGENPAHVWGVLFQGALGSPYQIAYGLFNATPLIFTGLSVSWGLRCGLFNIGAEGQMVIGALALFVVGHWSSGFSWAAQYPALAFFLMLVACLLAGGVWGGVAGFIRAYRGTHGVLTTILLNFIAYALLAFFIVDQYRDVTPQAPETVPLPDVLRLASFDWIVPGAAVNDGLFLALGFALIFHFLLWKTTLGWRQRFNGDSPQTARYNGQSVSKHIVLAMFIAGALAAPAGAAALLQGGMRLKEGLIHGAGFIGIAVALMGRTQAWGVVVSALFLGCLQQGALALDIETKAISRDMTVVIQATLILSLACDRFWRQWLGHFIPLRQDS